MDLYKPHRDIFLSYRDHGIDAEFASRLASDLREAGYSVYFNPDEKKSQDFESRLHTSVLNCKDFICIVSEDYLTDLFSKKSLSWVRQELLWAESAGKNIIPILINNAEMPALDADIPQELQFFPRKDAYTFPRHYITAPFSLLCGALHSKNDGTLSYRDVSNSNPNFNPEQVLSGILDKANAGDPAAMLEAGIYYYSGIAGDINDREAAKWFKKVSTLQNEYSMTADKFIARMYYAGAMPREPQSYEKSYEYHLRSAEDDIYSAGQVAFMQSIGSGCQFDYAATEAYYLSILDRLDNPRKATLCTFYMDHGEFQKAADIYKTMADVYPEAAYQLGLMYKRGVLSVPYMPDYHQAAHYFRLAAENGNTEAAYALATLYFNPTGTFKKDFEKAQKWFRTAADQGHTGAQYILGYMCRYGHVKQNLELAIHYFEAAAQKGHILSAAHLGLLYQISSFHNYEKAFHYCKIAAECGDIPSEFVLGTLYLSGRGCEANADKAYTHFRHAADCGNTEAQFLLDKMDEMGL